VGLIVLLRAAWPAKYGQNVVHDVAWPQIEKMIAENKLALEQLDALAVGMQPAMPPKDRDAVH
jgi:hypothetical protein